MNEREFRWIFRQTLDGDIYYDRNTRTVYRRRPDPSIVDESSFLTLPTFRYEAPLKVYFDFSYLCNFECRHCITSSSPRSDRQNELKPERIKSIMSELAAIGVLELGIGGGEPLCYPELFSLLYHAYTLGLNTILTTNGSLVTEDTGKLLKNSSVSEVRVSFDGSQPTHDYIRGAGNYRKALESVRILINCGIKAVPRLTICYDDEIGLDDLFKDLKSTGAASVKASLLESRGRASLSTNQNLFKYNRNVSTSNMLLDIAQKYHITLKLPGDLAGCAELADGGELRLGKTKSCGAGRETVYISPQGIVRPCSGMSTYSFGEVREDSFMHVWMNKNTATWREQAVTNSSWCLCTNISSILEDVNRNAPATL